MVPSPRGRSLSLENDDLLGRYPARLRGAPARHRRRSPRASFQKSPAHPPPCPTSSAACEPLSDCPVPRHTPAQPEPVSPREAGSAHDAPATPAAPALHQSISTAVWVAQSASKISLNLRRIGTGTSFTYFCDRRLGCRYGSSRRAKRPRFIFGAGRRLIGR